LTEDEKTLIVKCQKGDYEAFEILIDKYNERAYAVAFGVMGNHHDASDMTQESFIKVYKNIGKFNFRSSFNTWLYRIVKNTCIDELRKKKRKKVVSLDAGIEGDDGDYFMQVVDEKADIQAKLESEETTELVWSALEKLNEKHRSVLVLADIKGYDYLEISRMLDLPLGTVKSRISRARENMAEILKRIGTF